MRPNINSSRKASIERLTFAAVSPIVYGDAIYTLIAMLSDVFFHVVTSGKLGDISLQNRSANLLLAAITSSSDNYIVKASVFTPNLDEIVFYAYNRACATIMVALHLEAKECSYFVNYSSDIHYLVGVKLHKYFSVPNRYLFTLLMAFFILRASKGILRESISQLWSLWTLLFIALPCIDSPSRDSVEFLLGVISVISSVLGL